MQKLTEDQILKIYRRAWLGDSYSEIAQKYNVHPSTIRSIKHGKLHLQVTGHVVGTVPSFILRKKPTKPLTEDERKARRDAWTREMFEQYSGVMALDDYYLKLADENVDATEFKKMFWRNRTERGLTGKRFPRSEVIQFYNQFKNGCINDDD